MSLPAEGARHVYRQSDGGMHEPVFKVVRHGSYRWDPPLTDLSQLCHLHAPRISVDTARSDDVAGLAHDTLGRRLEIIMARFRKNVP